MEKIFLEITGRTEEHIEWCDELNAKIHRKVQVPLLALTNDAKKAGFNLKIVSGFRSFLRQEEIWNQKIKGERPILDDSSKIIDPKVINKEELVFLVLKWSAIPGASRHHWGTDFDFSDGNILDYRPTLTPEEYLEGGVFNPLYNWLKENAQNYNFYFPYNENLGGVNPEPWHLSYFPQAKIYLDGFTLDFFLENLKMSSIESKEILFNNAELIFKKFIQNISPFKSNT